MGDLELIAEARIVGNTPYSPECDNDHWSERDRKTCRHCKGDDYAFGKERKLLLLLADRLESAIKRAGGGEL